MQSQDLSKILPDKLDRLARKRAGRRIGWFTHLLVFVSVNLLVAVLSTTGGQPSGFNPLWGWGVGLAIHGAVVLLSTGGWGLLDMLVRAEHRHLKAVQSER